MVEEKKTSEDQDKQAIAPAQIVVALNEIADTKAGVIFLTWLMKRCFFDRSTISGNPQTYEVNSLGSICQEFQRRIYLDIRRHLKPELRQRIEK